MSFGRKLTHELTLEGENTGPLIIANRKNWNENRSDNKKHAINIIVLAWEFMFAWKFKLKNAWLKKDKWSYKNKIRK